MALTPDFATYPLVPVLAVTGGERWLDVSWVSGHVSRYHYVWLRDNCPCPACVHQVTKEQTFEILGVAGDLRPVAAPDSVAVTWPDGHVSVFDPGWLLAHCYCDDCRSVTDDLVEWDASLGSPPTFSGPAVLSDDAALLEWLLSLRRYGCSLLRDVPCDLDAVGRVAGRIGIVRETNFGVLWDVWAEPDPITNANTALLLPPHVDLPTREYQPGLQLLHCIENEAAGGESILVDGYRLASAVRVEHPDYYATLTTVPWNWANRSKTSDYRWTAPIIGLSPTGRVSEVRMGNWLRAPLVDVAFHQVEAAYEAYRCIFAMAYEERFQLRFRLEPGDLMAFDNRRILHARGAFTDTIGRRHLRGCYTERDELKSRIRMLRRR